MARRPLRHAAGDTEPAIRLWMLRILVTLGGHREFLPSDGFYSDAVAQALGLGRWIDPDRDEFGQKAVLSELRRLHRQAESRKARTPLPACLPARQHRATVESRGPRRNRLPHPGVHRLHPQRTPAGRHRRFSGQALLAQSLPRPLGDSRSARSGRPRRPGRGRRPRALRLGNGRPQRHGFAGRQTQPAVGQLRRPDGLHGSRPHRPVARHCLRPN